LNSAGGEAKSHRRAEVSLPFSELAVREMKVRFSEIVKLCHPPAAVASKNKKRGFVSRMTLDEGVTSVIQGRTFLLLPT
jgi:hypothetical protein